MARTAAQGSTRTRIARVIIAVLLLAPIAVLYDAAHRSAGDRQDAATHELLGVDYLRALQPLTVALLTAQGDAVAGRAVNAVAVSQAVATVDAADGRAGDSLGATDRWSTLRTKIANQPPPGANRAVFDAYSQMADLLLALYGRVQQSSGLAADPEVDTASLQRVSADLLPRVDVAVSRYVDLIQSTAGTGLSAAGAAEVLTDRQLAIASGGDLVDSLQSAVATTSSGTLGSDVLSEFDGMRHALDALAASAAPTVGAMSSADTSAAATLGTSIASASAALSTKVLDALTELLQQRRGAARNDVLRSDIGLGVGIVLIGLFLATDVGGRLRRSRTAPDDRVWGAEPAAVRRERVGAPR
jgi:hypothetical protein